MIIDRISDWHLKTYPNFSRCPTKTSHSTKYLNRLICPKVLEPKTNPFLDMDWVRNNEKIGSNRMRFILECLKDLDATLKQMGTRLFVLRGDSTTVIRKFCRGSFSSLTIIGQSPAKIWSFMINHDCFRLWNHANDLDEGCRSILSSTWSRNKNHCCPTGDCYEVFWWSNFVQSRCKLYTRDSSQLLTPMTHPHGSSWYF